MYVCYLSVTTQQTKQFIHTYRHSVGIKIANDFICILQWDIKVHPTPVNMVFEIILSSTSAGDFIMGNLQFLDQWYKQLRAEGINWKYFFIIFTRI